LLSDADASGKRQVVLGQNMSSSFEKVRVGRSDFHLELQMSANAMETDAQKLQKPQQKKKRLLSIVIPKDSLESISVIGGFGTDADAQIETLAETIQTLKAQRQKQFELKPTNGATKAAAVVEEVVMTEAAADAVVVAEAEPAPLAAKASMTLLEAYKLKVVGCFSSPGSSPEDLELKPQGMTCKLLSAALKKRKLCVTGKKAVMQARLKRYLADAMEEADIDESFKTECEDVTIVAAEGAEAEVKSVAPVAVAASPPVASIYTADCCRLVIRLKKPITVPGGDTADAETPASTTASLVLVDLNPHTHQVRRTWRNKNKSKAQSPRKNQGKSPRDNLAAACGEGGSLAAHISDLPIEKADADLLGDLLVAYLGQRAAVHELQECAHGCGALVHRFQLDSHQTRQCQQRPTKCSKCEEVMKFADIPKHKITTCPKMVVPCPLLCGAKAITSDALAEHALTCDKEIVHCPYSHQGCKIECTRGKLTEHCAGSMEHHLSLMAATLAKMQKAMAAAGIVLPKDE